MSEAGDLELFSTNDLIRELGRRFDNCIFAGVENRTENLIGVECQWHGESVMECIGLANYAAQKMARGFDDSGDVRYGGG